jgi:hypothetical protein
VPVKNVAILGGKSSFTNKKCFILWIIGERVGHCVSPSRSTTQIFNSGLDCRIFIWKSRLQVIVFASSVNKISLVNILISTKYYKQRPSIMVVILLMYAKWQSKSRSSKQLIIQ